MRNDYSIENARQFAWSSVTGQLNSERVSYLERDLRGKTIIDAVPREDELMWKFGLTLQHYRDKTHLRNYTEDSLQRLASSISCQQVQIFPEGAIPFRSVVRELVDFRFGHAAPIETFYRTVR